MRYCLVGSIDLGYAAGRECLITVNNIHFLEKQRFDPTLMGFLGVFVAFECYIALILWRGSHAGSIISACVCALILALAVLLRQFTIQVTDNDLSFGFGILRKRIKLSEIKSTSITEASLKTTGIGIHYCPGRYWAWVAKSGPAIKINIGSGNIAGYIISTSRPQDLTAALSSAIGQSAIGDSGR